MLRAEELMIGDWVHNTNKNRGKVIGFHYCTTSQDNEIVIQYGEKSTCWSQEALIEPIPLTPEILEKNGFVMDGFRDYVKGDATVYPATNKDHYTGTDHPVLSVWRAGCYRELRIRCDYVHTLQHALRLCGLTELADNIKIK